MTFFINNPQCTPNVCPKCSEKVVVDPLVTLGDVECSKCCQHLWFIQVHEVPVFFDRDETAEKKEIAIEHLSKKLKVARDQVADNPDLMYNAAIDSLSALEVFAELETRLAK